MPNVKILNSRFDLPLGGLRGNAWLDGKRVVDFQLVIIAILASSHGCGTIKRNMLKSAFCDGVGHFEHKF